MQSVKNIIFDLGGVILNLDIASTIKGFQALGASDFPSVYTQLKQHGLFDDFDKGLISEHDFHLQFNELTGLNLRFDTFEKVWNDMLLDFPAHRLQYLKDIKCDYRTFLLSNTNDTHVRAFEAQLVSQWQIPNLEPFFEKTYYSCRIGMRKPDTEIFRFVLDSHGLNAEETLFIDDSPQHVEGAKKCGINGILLLPGQDMTKVVPTLL